MGYRLIPRQRFQNDLDDALFYLAVKQSSPIAAVSFEAKLEKAFERLRDNPQLYSVSSEPGFCRRHIRKALVGDYLILYTVIGNEVLLLRLLHQKQDISRAIIE